MKIEKLNYSAAFFITGNYGYSASIFTGEKSTVDTDICEVWGKDKEEINERLKLISKAPEMHEALKEAVKEFHFHGWHNTTTVMKIESILKDLES